MASIETARNLVEMLLFKMRKLADRELHLGRQEYSESNTSLKCAVLKLHVNSEDIGYVLGIKGTNIRAVENLPGILKVDIHPSGLVTIMGENQENIEAARGYIEIVRETMPIPSNLVGSFIGTKGKEIMELQRMAECRINVQEQEGGGHRLELVGPRARVERGLGLAGYALQTLVEERSRETLISSLSSQLRSLHAGSARGGTSQGGQPRRRQAQLGPAESQPRGRADSSRGGAKGVGSRPNAAAAPAEAPPLRVSPCTALFRILDAAARRCHTRRTTARNLSDGRESGGGGTGEQLGGLESMDCVNEEACAGFGGCSLHPVPEVHHVPPSAAHAQDMLSALLDDAGWREQHRWVQVALQHHLAAKSLACLCYGYSPVE
mmetsp:Transcript_65913/g.176635  ORF Transcript_65913/g.176635 Transcript_65913/m.176635 type:complete len:379 (-) Transcript_65913:955-2091(-)